jgi:crotonobetainyl-CoA:carnitine CoA-transferase CaiB-like acyl-CoA transferase
MTRVEQLERAIEGLSPEERASFRAWFAAFDAAEWDQQFEADVAAGKLDRLADAALTEHHTGRSRKL